MNGALKALGKEVVLSIPYARERYFQREFLRRAPACKGTYRSFGEAMLHTPPGKLAGYDHPSIAEFHKERIDELNPGDYPVLFWLSRLLPEIKLVLELGGSIGRGYYSYRRCVPGLKDVRWVISDLREVVKVGRAIAAERKETHLTFTEMRELSDYPDLYASFGALQYIEEPFVEILDSLRVRPPHVLINRVPLSEGPGFITLQHCGSWFAPYKVDNRAEFTKRICALDYELVDTWQMDRGVSFLIRSGYAHPRYHGMYFRLRKRAPTPAHASRPLRAIRRFKASE